MTFYLGGLPEWLGRVDIPLFLSARALRRRTNFEVVRVPWALDSGGFTELQLYGKWKLSPEWYAAEVRKWMKVTGRLKWAAIQDWMCEPFMLQRTGKTIEEHQALTVKSYEDLKRLAPEVPWAPVLQGWRVKDYVRHREMYEQAGHDLARAPAVGVGSVCRRKDSGELLEIFQRLSGYGMSLHGFGVKTKNIAELAPYLASADSAAWSMAARYSPPLPGHSHKRCTTCPEFAFEWRAKVLERLVA